MNSGELSELLSGEPPDHVGSRPDHDRSLPVLPEPLPLPVALPVALPIPPNLPAARPISGHDGIRHVMMPGTTAGRSAWFPWGDRWDRWDQRDRRARRLVYSSALAMGVSRVCSLWILPRQVRLPCILYFI